MLLCCKSTKQYEDKQRLSEFYRSHYTVSFLKHFNLSIHATSLETLIIRNEDPSEIDSLNRVDFPLHFWLGGKEEAARSTSYLRIDLSDFANLYWLKKNKMQSRMFLMDLSSKQFRINQVWATPLPRRWYGACFHKSEELYRFCHIPQEPHSQPDPRLQKPRRSS